MQHEHDDKLHTFLQANNANERASLVFTDRLAAFDRQIKELNVRIAVFLGRDRSVAAGDADNVRVSRLERNAEQLMSMIEAKEEELQRVVDERETERKQLLAAFHVSDRQQDVLGAYRHSMHKLHSAMRNLVRQVDVLSRACGHNVLIAWHKEHGVTFDTRDTTLSLARKALTSVTMATEHVQHQAEKVEELKDVVKLKERTEEERKYRDDAQKNVLELKNRHLLQDSGAENHTSLIGRNVQLSDTATTSIVYEAYTPLQSQQLQHISSNLVSQRTPNSSQPQRPPGQLPQLASHSMNTGINQAVDGGHHGSVPRTNGNTKQMNTMTEAKHMMASNHRSDEVSKTHGRVGSVEGDGHREYKKLSGSDSAYSGSSQQTEHTHLHTTDVDLTPDHRNISDKASRANNSGNSQEQRALPQLNQGDKVIHQRTQDQKLPGPEQNKTLTSQAEKNYSQKAVNTSNSTGIDSQQQKRRSSQGSSKSSPTQADDVKESIKEDVPVKDTTMPVLSSTKQSLPAMLRNMPQQPKYRMRLHTDTNKRRRTRNSVMSSYKMS